MLANVKIELRMNFFEVMAALSDKRKLETCEKAGVFGKSFGYCLIIFHYAVSIGDVPFSLRKEMFKTGLS
jgi:hypothetical protein